MPSQRILPREARFTGLGDWVCLSDLKEYEGHNMVDICLQGACVGCAKILGDMINDKRQDIWEKVPSYFGFPGWDELQRKLEEIC